jgi:glucose uptake protein GlcU
MRWKINLDNVGIATSVLCAIHCAALPLLFTSLPLLGVNIINNEYFEFGMIALALVIGYISLGNAYKSHHKSKLPLVIFSIGAIFLIGKELLPHNGVSFWLALCIAITGIIGGHVINYGKCRQAKQCHVNHDGKNHSH